MSAYDSEGRTTLSKSVPSGNTNSPIGSPGATVWSPSRYPQRTHMNTPASTVKDNANSQKVEDDEDEMEDIPLDDDDDKPERSRWQKPTFLHSKRDQRQQQGSRYRSDNTSSDEDDSSSESSDDSSSSSDDEGNKDGKTVDNFGGSNSANVSSKDSPPGLKRLNPTRSMFIGAQRTMSSCHIVSQSVISSPQSRHNLLLSPQRQHQVIKVHLKSETMPQIVLFTSPNSDEITEIRIVAEDSRSSQQFNVSVCNKWNIGEIKKAFCDRQALRTEEFEALFESVDIPCRLDRTPAELEISCVRLSRSTKSRILCEDIKFDPTRSDGESKCCNLDYLIDRILASDPFDISTCETLVYFVSRVTTPRNLLSKLIGRFNTFAPAKLNSTNNDDGKRSERRERILTILLLWIDSNPLTIINTPDTLHIFTSFLTTVAISHHKFTQSSQCTFNTLIEHFRSKYFTSDLLIELSSRLRSSLITKDRKTTKGLAVLEWLCKELKFSLSDAKLVVRNLVLRGHIRAIDPTRPSAQRRYYFPDEPSSDSHSTQKIVTEIPPERFAYQMALFLFNLFCKIDVIQEFASTDSFPCCNEYLAVASKLTLWLRWEMLFPTTAEARLKALKWLIRVAEASLSIGSFGGADIAISALDSVPLKRMKTLWAPLSPKKRAMLTEILKQVRPSDGYRGYHSAVASLVASRLPVVPIIRVHLMEVAQAATVCDEMCWRKLFFAAVPVREVLAMQKVPYEPRFEKEVQEIIGSTSLKSDRLNDKVLYQTTLVIEPLHDQEEELKNASLMSIINGVEYIPLKKE